MDIFGACVSNSWPSASVAGTVTDHDRPRASYGFQQSRNVLRAARVTSRQLERRSDDAMTWFFQPDTALAHGLLRLSARSAFDVFGSRYPDSLA